jgi:hypothetical protein
MFSLAPEIARLRDDGVITPEIAAPLIASERREIVSIYAEVRFLMWGGVMLIVSGVGVLVSKHLDEIGPLAIALAIGMASAACYAWATWKRKRTASLVDDYVLLLAALLLSADAGFIERTWHFLGTNWKDYLIVLAIVHAATAYIFDSRLVLSVSLTSLAAYLGIQRNIDSLFGSSRDTAARAFDCAAIVLVWRDIDRRTRKRRTFTPVFDHYIANLAFWGALILSADSELRLLGCAIGIALAAASATFGIKTHSEMFVIYAWIYGLIAVNVALYALIPDVAPFFTMVSSIAAIVGLFVIHTQMRAAEA